MAFNLLVGPVGLEPGTNGLYRSEIMKVGIYVRVSTQQQTTENQLLDLYEVCERGEFRPNHIFNWE